MCNSAKQHVRQFFQQESGVFSPPPPSVRSAPCSFDSMMHYSFDMAQQVHYPSDPLQPGPIYFLTPRKCGIFGVCCEAIPRQINYLIDEASDTGKGSNAIVSMLHHFFQEHGLGETCAPTCRQLCWAKQKQYNVALPHLASDGWSPQENISVVSYCWPHQVRSRLVFRAPEATFSPYKGGLPCRPRASCQPVSRGQRLSVNSQPVR